MEGNMKWSDNQTSQLKKLCYEGKSNKEIAQALNCNISDVYNKRSQMGITINKVAKIDEPKHAEPCKPRNNIRESTVKLDFDNLDELQNLAEILKNQVIDINATLEKIKNFEVKVSTDIS
jgi:hypothetical protein